jgi:Ca2+-binding EF-hand superfamily protein
VLDEQIQKYFTEFDEDTNGFLDRRELRHFLVKFFQLYKIHFPITDEFVDGLFRQIDANHDNKIQPDELEQFAMNCISSQILPKYKQALSEKE